MHDLKSVFCLNSKVSKKSFAFFISVFIDKEFFEKVKNQFVEKNQEEEN